MKARVAVVQMDCVLGDISANLARIEARARQAVEGHGADLVIFPECATTGYFVGQQARDLAEAADGPANRLLAGLARDLGAHLAVGVIEAEGDQVFDAQALFAPDRGLIASYRKVHLFGGEKAIFTPGTEPCVVDTALGRLALTVCYDLMFPEYVRGLVLAGAQLIVNSTDWVTDPWQAAHGWAGPTLQALCQVRALENGVHVAMADRVGDEIRWTSLGYSTIAGPTGAALGHLEASEGIVAATVEDPTPDLERWRSVATYLGARQPDLYERIATGMGSKR